MLTALFSHRTPADSRAPENVKSKLKWDLQIGHQADFDLGKYAAMMFPNLWIKETAANIVRSLGGDIFTRHGDMHQDTVMALGRLLSRQFN